MINKEDEILASIVENLRNKLDILYFTNEELSDIPATFPAVSIRQTNNIPNTRYSTFDSIWNVGNSTFYVEIYSDKDFDECNSIAKIIIDAMSDYEYICKLNSPNINEDKTYFRKALRFTRNNLVY